MEILIVEDDVAIRRAAAKGLTEAGHEVLQAASGEKALELIAQRRPDVIVLDVMLAELTGFDVLQRLRSSGIATPTIMLTALGTVEERVLGLSLGADDYLVKPFAFSELLARVEALHRRSSHKPSSTLLVGSLTLDLTTRCVFYGERRIELTPTEFTLLELLMRYAGQVVSRDMLCRHVWGFSWTGETNVIEVHMTRLRQKLERCGATSIIQTVRGRGYAIL